LFSVVFAKVAIWLFLMVNRLPSSFSVVIN